MIAREGLSSRDAQIRLAAMWRTLTPEEKLPYEIMQQQSREERDRVYAAQLRSRNENSETRRTDDGDSQTVRAALELFVHDRIPGAAGWRNI